MSRRTTRASGAMQCSLSKVVAEGSWQISPTLLANKMCGPGFEAFLGHFSLHLFCNPDPRYLLLSGWQKVWNKKNVSKKNVKVTKEIRCSGGQMKGDISIPSEG